MRSTSTKAGAIRETLVAIASAANGRQIASSNSAGAKPHLSFMRILQMNLGFLGLQYSFGLQQANMSPIWGYLGAKEADFSWLGIAGPLTGLIVQPIIGVMSDRTGGKWGRRTPYFLIGAVMCMLGLFLMPLSTAVIMAFSLMFLLDVGNNVTMEPYRAYVNDRLNPDQRGIGFLSQSAFTGLAQTLAYLSPSLLVWFGMSETAHASGGIPKTVLVSFWIGAFLSITTILWSILRVPELPLSAQEQTRIDALPKSVGATFSEIFGAVKDMPKAMRTMAWMSLFQWYAMCGLWGYANNSVARSVFHTANDKSAEFEHAHLLYGQVGALYNFIAFLTAFMMPSIAKRIGASRLHALCLVAMAISFFALPLIENKALIFLPAIGFGLGWASIMGNPYIVLASSIPAERTGVYMGLFNVMICAPMILYAVSMRFMYEPVWGGDPRHVLMLSGVLMLMAAAAVSRIRIDQAPGA
jgi:maltose/moltooligosaccharide transporter